MLFKKKPKKEKPAAVYSFTQTENYRGFKRTKLSSYGYKPAMDGIAYLSNVDLTGAEIKISIYGGEHPRAVASVGSHEAGTMWEYNSTAFGLFKNKKVEAVRLEIRDGDAYLFYKM